MNKKNINDLIYNIKRNSNSKNSRNNLKSLTNKFKNSTLIKIANSSKLSNFGKSSKKDKLLIYKNLINNNNNLGKKSILEKDTNKIYNMKSKINKNKIKENNKKENKIELLYTDIKEFDYKEAIIFNKISYLKMYWSFLSDSQIILGTIFNNNDLDLFTIKLSFLVFTFQISFFLNALFYYDEYISDAYHNDGVLDFFSGLPKSIYSFISALLINNLLKILSSSKSELFKIIRKNHNFHEYIKIINIKLAKLRKKLIIYFILIYLLQSFFLYYVSVFCAVYKYSQKYWLLESFGIDFLSSLIGCIFLALLRYISIKNRIKCLYRFVDTINTFF